jgi:GNAT superfamily N-acetyltransferase
MNVHCGYLPGCIGRIVELHATHYAAAVGFGLPFETRVASELAAFCHDYDDARDGLWLAQSEGRVEGSIAIDGSHAGEKGAHLRWFITSPVIRGQGAGNALLSAALGFCDGCGYGKVHLWTFDGLHAARHLYEKHGFRLTLTQRGSQWGKEVDEQLFTRGGA